MEGINDIAFRTLCKKAGAKIVFSEMTHPLTKQKIFVDDKPVIQLFCTNEKGITEFIKKYDKKVFGWDFNLGCPAKTARKHGFGIFLHEKTNSIEKILKKIRSSTKKPFFIKLRKSPQTLKILKIAEKYCDAITIHPRTQSQGYSGKPDLKFAEQLKQKTDLPIIYSGNVDEKNYKYLLKKFDYLMIGRRAIGDPNVFNIFSKKKTSFSFKDYLKLAKKYNLPFRQIKLQAMNFTKRKPDAKKIRLEIFKAKNMVDIKNLTLRKL